MNQPRYKFFVPDDKTVTDKTPNGDAGADTSRSHYIAIRYRSGYRRPRVLLSVDGLRDGGSSHPAIMDCGRSAATLHLPPSHASHSVSA